MEFRQLRYFKAIADARSFARGAQDLRVAQPALSRSIAKLEDELGKNLFIRHSGGVSLTDDGVRFYDYASQVLGSMKHLVEGMAAEDDQLKGEISIGAPHSIQSILVLPVAAAFMAEYPLCKINIMQNSSARLRDHLAADRLDLAILPAGNESGVHLTPLVGESICLLMRPEDRKAFPDSVEIRDLIDLPLILTGYPDALLLMFDRLFPDQSRSLNVRCEVNSSSLLVDLVEKGAGIGVGPCSIIAQRPQSELAYVPIRGFETSWTIATNWQRRGLRAVSELERQLVRRGHDLLESGSWPTAIALQP